MLELYPKFNAEEQNKEIEAEIDWLKRIVIAIRTIRSEMGISPAKRIPVIFNKGDDKDKACVNHFEDYIKTLAKVDDIQWSKDGKDLSTTATNVINQLEIHIPLEGLIDKQAELARLNKEINKLQKEQEKSANKLENPSYVEKAPADVVKKERQKLQQAQETLEKLQKQQQKIEKIEN